MNSLIMELCCFCVMWIGSIMSGHDHNVFYSFASTPLSTDPFLSEEQQQHTTVKIMMKATMILTAAVPKTTTIKQ